MVAPEQLCERERPDWVVVVGGVDSIMACTVIPKRFCIRVVRTEAGPRGCGRRNRRIPEIMGQARSGANYRSPVGASGVNERRSVAPLSNTIEK